MPEQLQKPVTPEILYDLFIKRCAIGKIGLNTDGSDDTSSDFKAVIEGAVCLDQLADAINEYFGYFPTIAHEVGQCGADNDTCYFCRKENVPSA
jgi:hypothetical protein